ncbi:MAG: aldose epimerase family protein [Bacteroidota bacterium]
MTNNALPEITIKREPFGTLADGQIAELFTLRNRNGMEVKITNFGGIITHLIVPDKNGHMGDVVLGFDTLAGYVDEHPYFGAIVGRYGNRIAKGKFSINGKTYTLATNNGPNHLHGGLEGFDKKLWEATIVETENHPFLRLQLTSPDGEEGYPGTLRIQVDYTLNIQGELRMDYTANTDQPTHVNLTNHAYFNLTSDPGQTILNHEVAINADSFIPVDETLIPTGEIASLDDSPLDFRTTKTIGRDIEVEKRQIKYGGGYDHCWVLKRNASAPDLQLAATAHDPASGRTLEVLTTEPGIQFYTGNFLDGTLVGKNGTTYLKRTGFCLETEHFPDSPNQPNFPPTLLQPGETYQSATVYRFSVRRQTD